MRPVRRTIIGISALGAISLVRNTYPNLPLEPVNITPDHAGSSAKHSLQPQVSYGGTIVAEVIQVVSGAVDTASAATPCAPNDTTPNRATYCIVATPAPTTAPTPVPVTKTATPRPVSTTTTQTSSKGVPSQPTFRTDTPNVQPGNSVTLTWLSNGATNCLLNPGAITVAGTSGSYVTNKLTATTVFTLACSNSHGSSTASPLTVKVSSSGAVTDATPGILSFGADPANIASGQNSTLSWIASGIPHGGCNLNPSPLGQTDATGSWTTPYLLGSKSYTLTCQTAKGDVFYASTSVTVNGISASAAPAPTTGNLSGNQDKTFKTDTGQIVMNGAVLDVVSGLVTLDPSLFTDPSRAGLVAEVKFFEDTKLLQTITVEPFVLDTTKLTNGKHPITQRTYFRDDSVGEVTRILSINNLQPVNQQSSLPLLMGLGLFIVLAAAVGGGVWLKLRRTPARTGSNIWSSNPANFKDSIDTTLINRP